MDDIRQHIYLRIPPLHSQPRPTSKTRDERIRTIIANLDKQHQQVRNNIATAGISHYTSSLQNQTQAHTDNDNNDDDAMEISPTSPSPPPQDYSGGSLYSDATLHLIANLNTPHDPRNGDPCLPPGGQIPPPVGVVQAEAPAGMKAAREVLERIREYDETVKAGVEFYGRALERRGSAGGASVPGSGPVAAATTWNGVVAASGSGGGGMAGGAHGPAVHPDRMRQVESRGDVFGRRW